MKIFRIVIQWKKNYRKTRTEKEQFVDTMMDDKSGRFPK